MIYLKFPLTGNCNLLFSALWIGPNKNNAIKVKLYLPIQNFHPATHIFPSTHKNIPGTSLDNVAKIAHEALIYGTEKSRMLSLLSLKAKAFFEKV